MTTTMHKLSTPPRPPAPRSSVLLFRRIHPHAQVVSVALPRAGIVLVQRWEISEVIGWGHRVSPSGLPIEQVLGVYSFS